MNRWSVLGDAIDKANVNLKKLSRRRVSESDTILAEDARTCWKLVAVNEEATRARIVELIQPSDESITLTVVKVLESRESRA